ncbi:hypothetical protein J4E89_007684 [Alternaria sp. Ai002NY15]|nr:hypothetical protein J4E89_007684 [Alternaria sp. Ai002NY15]
MRRRSPASTGSASRPAERMTPRLLQADDVHNPSYYELRAGHPPPNDNFYYGRESDTEPKSEPHFTEDNFIRGFNMTPGQFYRLREEIIPLLLKGKLYRVQKQGTDLKYPLHEIYAHVRKQEMIKASPAHVYWKKQMIRNFVGCVAQWLKTNESHIDDANEALFFLPREAHWNWGLARKHPKPDGFYQFQHMTIRVFNEPDLNDHSILLCEFNVRDLIDDEERPELSPEDIDPALLQYSRLISLITSARPDRFKDGFDEAKVEIKCERPETQRLMLRIFDDNSLEVAVSSLRKKEERSINITLYEKQLALKGCGGIAGDREQEGTQEDEEMEEPEEEELEEQEQDGAAREEEDIQAPLPLREKRQGDDQDRLLGVTQTHGKIGEIHIVIVGGLSVEEHVLHRLIEHINPNVQKPVVDEYRLPAKWEGSRGNANGQFNTRANTPRILVGKAAAIRLLVRYAPTTVEAITELFCFAEEETTSIAATRGSSVRDCLGAYAWSMFPPLFGRDPGQVEADHILMAFEGRADTSELYVFEVKNGKILLWGLERLISRVPALERDRVVFNDKNDWDNVEDTFWAGYYRKVFEPANKVYVSLEVARQIARPAQKEFGFIPGFLATCATIRWTDTTAPSAGMCTIAGAQHVRELKRWNL